MKVLFNTIGLLAVHATVLTALYFAGHYFLMREMLEPNRLYQAWIVSFSLFAIWRFVFEGERK